ncbi:hypothetical protein [Riemerella columbina]|uniref:hypothetical protein n=1 Tax=Riemerella columbina TaxID=103810 RepID=UPI00266FB489|nr:hypothetical protein [Riemerella columbina]WKS95424.1 hypothetical protein NYR17_01405 [Riemerella columbina]
MSTHSFTPAPVKFKLGEYLNQGFELFKNHMSTIILAFLALIVMSIIPLCGIMALGNFIKLCRKLNRGENASAGDIFDFSDFRHFLKLSLIVWGFSLLIQIPLTILTDANQEPTPLFSLYILAMYLVAIYFLIKGYYVVALMELERHSLMDSWKLSKQMSKGNGLNIIGFAIIVSLISAAGFILFCIGIILSIPLVYAIQYASYEDGIQQTKTKATIF